MKRGLLFTLLVMLCGFSPMAQGQDLHGSGSTFLFPVMTKWAEAFEAATGITVHYQPIGSAEGVNEVVTGVVDFGVSDAPMNDAQLLRDGLTQLPLAIGGIVPVINVDGVTPGTLRLTGGLLADIWLGKITRWDDPAILALNPGLTLPHQRITPIYRSDGSGTTYNWTDYLSKMSPEWFARVGAGTKVAWPLGAGAKGGKGVAEAIARVAGSIGYLEYGYATRRSLAFALVRNHDGQFVPPGHDSFAAATTGVDFSHLSDVPAALADSQVPGAWPIMAMSFAILRSYPQTPERILAARFFLRWSLEHGRDATLALAFMPLPPTLLNQVMVSLATH
jgi:phosphate transport system substrate-binding protein